MSPAALRRLTRRALLSYLQGYRLWMLPEAVARATPAVQEILETPGKGGEVAPAGVPASLRGPAVATTFFLTPMVAPEARAARLTTVPVLLVRPVMLVLPVMLAQVHLLYP